MDLMATDGAEGVEFEPVTRDTLSEQIRTRVLDHISSGLLAPGDRIPSERALSEQFGVARTSVREAMQGLLSLGVIVRRGNGSYVADDFPDLLLEEVDERKRFIRHLFETRRLLEVPMMELAAVRATDEQRQKIAEMGRRFDDDLPVVKFRELDRQFHAMISNACGNPVLAEMYSKVLARLFRSDEIADLLHHEANASEVATIVRESGKEHRRLSEALVAGDVAGASAIAAEHLEAVERRMIDRLH